jgi:hypothetical protein
VREPREPETHEDERRAEEHHREQGGDEVAGTGPGEPCQDGVPFGGVVVGVLDQL